MEKEKEKSNICSPDTVLGDFLRTSDSHTVSSNPSTSDSDSDSDSQTLFDAKSSPRLARLLKFFKLLKRFRTTSSSSIRKEGSSVLNPWVDGNLRNFSFYQLKTATNNFCQEYLIGKGGYAEVYRGYLHGGQIIAVKRLTGRSVDERISGFLSELGIMAHVNHPNTAKLLGYGVEGGMHIVLEFSALGSLASVLHGSVEKVSMSWERRYKVALGTAKGLLYLHEGCQRRIIHRDIKAANILLTKDFEPQICDFGLSKWLPEDWTHLTVSNVEGTFGYLAPEFLSHGIVDEKTDIFAFGVLLLELVTGRKALDYSKQSLVMWAHPLLKTNNIEEVIDPELSQDYAAVQMNIMILCAALCVHRCPTKRPRMSQILLLLRGSCGSVDLMRKQGMNLSSWKKFYQKMFTVQNHIDHGEIDGLDSVYKGYCK